MDGDEEVVGRGVMGTMVTVDGGDDSVCGADSAVLTCLAGNVRIEVRCCDDGLNVGTTIKA